MFKILIVVGIIIHLTAQLQLGDPSDALRYAKRQLKRRAKAEAKILGVGLGSRSHGPQESNTAAEFTLYFMQSVCENQGGCNAQDISDFKEMDLFGDLALHCRQEVNCSQLSSEYRTIDGTCNNLLVGNSLLGSSGTPYGRYIDPAYEDYISAPRSKSVTNEPLKSPRIITDLVMKDFPLLDKDFTTAMVYFGQLLTHESVKTPMITLDGFNIPCCDKKSKKFDGCLPIKISKCDTFYSEFRRRCMSTARSKASLNVDCKFDVRQQETAVTHFFDASFLYGSNFEEADSVRTYTDGLLIATNGNLLPIIIKDGCSAEAQDCNFLGGDRRVNENTALALLHTIFLREHNRIAAVIKSLKPTYDDEKIFQETRKIIIGIFQSITYREYVPAAIGTAAVTSYNLNIDDIPDDDVYKTSVIPVMKNAFITAAFRFGHPTVATLLNVDLDDGTVDSVPLVEGFNSPFELYDTNLFNGITKGLTTQCPRKTSVFMSSAVSKQLNNTGGSMAFGDDLGAINTQRGRDHGLPSYNAFREYCNLPKLMDFTDMLDIGPAMMANLKQVYKDVNDIDLFLGGLLEAPVNGGAVGPTFACLMAEQFDIIRSGDRYFYTNGRSNDENDNPELVGHGYSQEQITEFNKASLARLFCDHTNIDMVQPQVMRKIDNGSNQVVYCNSLPKLTISKFV